MSGTLAAERLPLLAPCTLDGIEETVLCGTLEVAEDRSKADGRRIVSTSWSCRPTPSIRRPTRSRSSREGRAAAADSGRQPRPRSRR